ncbi:HAMP domain-containing protein [Heliobacillus mobilis]|uniref:histidine kinase n=1 Tax=Heliobacterium mobile TaxID=28064 RepID=A0A6I3SMG7_HELMO|nr:HAMP domain-containing sensor histidine kinase [Heliobacterium mobile]MTV49966.1 HAMP domain-containing protein [Heliobacterium mobile]
MKIRNQAFLFFLVVSAVAAAITAVGGLIIYQELLQPHDNDYERRRVAEQIGRWQTQFKAQPIQPVDPGLNPSSATYSSSHEQNRSEKTVVDTASSSRTPVKTETEQTDKLSSVDKHHSTENGPVMDRLREQLRFDRNFYLSPASVQVLDSTGRVLVTKTTWNPDEDPAIAAADQFPNSYNMAQLLDAAYKPPQEDPPGLNSLFKTTAVPIHQSKIHCEVAPLYFGDETYFLLVRYETEPSSTPSIQEKTFLLAGIPLTAGTAVLVIDLIAALAFAWLLRSPLKKLGAALENMKRGDTQFRIKSWRKDEFGDLFSIFNQLNAAWGILQQREQEIAGKQRDLLAGLSHDLRTPLASIEGYAEALSDIAYREPDKAQKYGHIIHSKSLIMGRIVDDLFLTAKLIHPDFHLEQRPADLSELIRRWLADMLADIELAGDSLEADIPEGPLWSSVDALHLERAIKNVIKNAAEHNGPGIRITVSLSSDGRSHILHIADNGKGVPAHVRDRLFERFARADTARRGKNGSTGLGLAISREIIAAHGGSILLDSDSPEGGAAFLIRLPLCAAPQTPSPRKGYDDKSMDTPQLVTSQTNSIDTIDSSDSRSAPIKSDTYLSKPSMDSVDDKIDLNQEKAEAVDSKPGIIATTVHESPVQEEK